MENITLGAMSGTVLWIVAFIGGIMALYSLLKKAIQKMLEKEFKTLNEKVDDIDLESCKDFLVRFLSDAEKGEPITDIERQRFWERYEHYQNKNGNSYIKEWVEKLKKKECL